MAKIRSKALIAMAGAMAMRARDYARENPEKVAQTLDSVEAAVSHRTQGKYDSKVRKGSSALRKGLGLPSTASGAGGGTGAAGTTSRSTGAAGTASGGTASSDTASGGTASPLSSTTPPSSGASANGRPDLGAGI
ncbi:MAG TPA: antitoxin [Ornithinibacter sp.]|nr:antitoxin [Ornithinibacter sp.]